MTLVYSPPAGHHCDIDWERELITSGPFYVPGETKYHAVMVHRNDPPGTVRRCETCGKHWVAQRHPRVSGGQQQVGVFWRPEKRRERRTRERAARA